MPTNLQQLKDKQKKDCCFENISKAKWISRATWVCPICGKDISLMYMMYCEAIKSGKKWNGKIIKK